MGINTIDAIEHGNRHRFRDRREDRRENKDRGIRKGIRKIRERRKKSRERGKAHRDAAESAMNEALQGARDLQAPGGEQLMQGSEITADRQGLDAQRSALSNMQQTAAQGYNAQDRASLNAAMAQSGQQARADREAQLQQARARGMGGSGMEFASALASSQGAANRNAAVAADLGQNRLDRQFQANQAVANQAGNLNTQQAAFNQQTFENRNNALNQGFQNQAQRQEALGGQLTAATAYNTDRANRIGDQRHRVLNMLKQSGDSALSSYLQRDRSGS
jgi:hypothetical protein